MQKFIAATFAAVTANASEAEWGQQRFVEPAYAPRYDGPVYREPYQPYVEPKPEPVVHKHVAKRTIADEPKYAKCALKDPEEEAWIGGLLNFSQMPGDGVKIDGEIWGITPGKHGFHVHSFGDLRGGCKSLGGHWGDDAGADHAAHAAAYAKADGGKVFIGDLPAAVANEKGVAQIDIYDKDLELAGDKSIIGRSLVIHSGPEGGARVACCTIGIAAGPKPSKW